MHLPRRSDGCNRSHQSPTRRAASPPPKMKTCLPSVARRLETPLRPVGFANVSPVRGTSPKHRAGVGRGVGRQLMRFRKVNSTLAFAPCRATPQRVDRAKYRPVVTGVRHQGGETTVKEFVGRAWRAAQIFLLCSYLGRLSPKVESTRAGNRRGFAA